MSGGAHTTENCRDSDAGEGVKRGGDREEGLENAMQNLAVARTRGTISLNWGRVI